MKLFALTALSIALATGAQAQTRSTGGDANGDGRLSLAEFQAVQGQRMMRLDSDGDGRISAAEWSAMPRGAKAKPAADPARAFGRLDRNNDGALDRGEVDSTLARRFARLDADKDGQLTAAERQASKKARGGARAAPSPQ